MMFRDQVGFEQINQMEQSCQVCKAGKTFCRCYTCNLQLCQACDQHKHQEGYSTDQAKFQTSHKRGMLCSECEEEDAFGYCEDCEQFMCQTCSKIIHNKGARLRHVLDQQILYDQSFINSTSHQRDQLNDKSGGHPQSNQPRNLPLIPVISSIQIQVSTPRRTVVDLTKMTENKTIEDVKTQKVAPLKQEKPGEPHQPIQKKTQFKPNPNPHHDVASAMIHYPNQTSVPTFQPLLVDSSEPLLTHLLVLLREQASEGNLMISYSHFVWLIETELRMSKTDAKQLLLKAEQRGYIIVTVRSFGCVKTLTLISMKLNFITIESIQWVLRGLKRDGMCPNERAVQSRIKEAFGVKINTHLWDLVMESLQAIQEPRYLTQEGKAEAKTELQNLKIPKDTRFELKYELEQGVGYEVKCTERVEETETSQSVVNLYLLGERYLGQDQSFIGPVISPDLGEVDKQREIMNDKIVYGEFKKFLNDYFLTTKFDNIDSDQRENEASDEYLQTLKANSISSKNVKQSGPVKKQKHNPLTSQLSSTLSGSSDSTQTPNLNLSPGLSDFNEDGKAIPGGRYGCAQFVKLCGPQILREQSLGKLAQMVQRSINEDYLRYQRTLLILTQCIDKTKAASPINTKSNSSEEEQIRLMQKKAEIGAKLQAVKCSILEVLAEHKEGVSLPQLPIFLKRKLPFKLDWNQLGFAKLKDLITSMNDQIKLELIGPNHTLAYLIYSKRFHHTNGAYSDDLNNIPRLKNLISDKQKYSIDLQSNDFKNNLLVEDCKKLEQVLALFYQMLKEFPMGIDSFRIVPWISDKLDQPFDIRAFGCQSIYEFIRKFIMPTTEIFIINNKPDSFLIRSNQIYSSVQQNQPSSGSNSYKRKESDSASSLNNHSESSSSFSNNKSQRQQFNQKNPQHPTSQETPRSSAASRAANQRKIEPPPTSVDESEDNGSVIYQPTKPAKENYANKFVNPYESGHQSRRMPSGASTFHMPCASSFYGQNNDDGQSQIQINISHIRTNTDGEITSQNATQIHHHLGHQNSGVSSNNPILPQHLYNMSSGDFNNQQQEWQKLPVNYQNQQHEMMPYQDAQYKIQNNHGGGTAQEAGTSGIHQQTNSYGSLDGGFLSFGSKPMNNPMIPQLSPFQLYENIDSSNNSPRHNRAVSYLYNHSMTSSQDFSSNYNINQPLSTSHHQPFYNGNPFIQGSGFFTHHNHLLRNDEHMPVHKEASKESSLEGSSQSSKKKHLQQNNPDDVEEDKLISPADEEINPPSLVEGGAEDESQSPLHSRFIEDLLGEEGDTTTDVDLLNSQKTTVVHTPQLSMSSFYKQLPPTQGSSYYPAQQHQHHNSSLVISPAYGQNRQGGTSAFDHSGESEEASVHLMMNNLMIQVGHNNGQQPANNNQMNTMSRLTNLQHTPMKAGAPPNMMMQSPSNNGIARNVLGPPQQQQDQNNFYPYKNQNYEQNQAQFMHNKAMSEDFSTQQSLFAQQFVFNSFVPDNQPQRQQMQTQLNLNAPSFTIQQHPQQQNHQPPMPPQYNNFVYSQQAPPPSQHQHPWATANQQPQLQRIQVELKQPAGPPSVQQHELMPQRMQGGPQLMQLSSGIHPSAIHLQPPRSGGAAHLQQIKPPTPVMHTQANVGVRPKMQQQIMASQQQLQQQQQRQAKVFQTKRQY